MNLGYLHDSLGLPLMVATATAISFFYLQWFYFLGILPGLVAFFLRYYKNRPCDVKHVETFFSGFRVGGHRGSPHAFPENSMAGFEQAKLEGADLIEFDVALTKDGHAVLLHDDDLDRTTNLKGPIRNKSLLELATADISSNFKRTAPGTMNPVSTECLPLLETVVQWAVKNQMRMLFDVKDSDAELVDIIGDLFEKYSLYDKAIVCSFFPSVVYRMKRGNQKILTGLTWRKKFFSHHDIENRRPRFTGVTHYLVELMDALHVAALKTVTPWFLGADLLLTNNLDISQSFVNQQRAWGRYVAVWTVNDMAEMHWMLETLKIPILTDHPHYTQKVKYLENAKNRNYQD